MAWVKIDDGFSEHPKLLQAGPLAMAMQIAALCYCNRNLTDGFVPRAAAARLLDLTGIGMRMWNNGSFGGGEDATWELVVEDLVSAGVWDVVPGGWRIHDYLEYQPSKASVLEEREKTRQRVNRWRERNAVTNGVGNAECNGVSNAAPDPVPDPDPVFKKEKEEARPPPRTVRDELSRALDSEHVEALIEHRKAKRAKLTPRAAKLLADKFAKCPDPNAAVDAMIAHGWQGFEPEWLENRTRGSPLDPQKSAFVKRLEAELASGGGNS